MQTSEEQALSRKKSARYVKIAVVFLFLLAATWSIDAAFVYFFLGGLGFCLFMAARHFPFERQQTQEDNRQYRERQRGERGPGREQQTSSSYQAPPTVTPAADVNKRKAIRAIIIFFVIFFGLFMVGVFASLIGGSDFSDGWFYAQEGQRHFDLEQYDSARFNYRKALKEDPDNGDYALSYGKTLSYLEQYDSSLIMLNKALEINPDSEEAMYFKAWVYFSKQDFSKTEELLKALNERNPSYVDPMRLMGSTYYAQKRYDEAITWFERVYATGERTQWLCHVMAYIYDSKGDNEKAIALYKEALAQDDSTVSIYQRLGELLPGEEGNYYRTEAFKRQSQSN